MAALEPGIHSSAHRRHFMQNVQSLTLQAVTSEPGALATGNGTPAVEVKMALLLSPWPHECEWLGSRPACDCSRQSRQR